MIRVSHAQYISVESLRPKRSPTVNDIWLSELEDRNHIDDLHTKCDD